MRQSKQMSSLLAPSRVAAGHAEDLDCRIPRKDLGFSHPASSFRRADQAMASSRNPRRRRSELEEAYAPAFSVR